MAAAATAATTPQRWLQRGVARLTATADASGKTRLTQVSHEAPLRLVPIPSSRIQQAGAAVCALSSYGGGMLPGDVHNVSVKVQSNATLGLVTQGSQRIYKRNNSSPHLYCRSVLDVSVASNALFVYGMDPCVPFRHSSFQQHVCVNLESSDASIILVDWFGAGRLSRGEFWDFDTLSSKTILRKNGEDVPFLVESMHLDNTTQSSSSSVDASFGFQQGKWNAYCSVILHGPQAQPVARRLQDLSLQLASDYTRVRSSMDTNKESFQRPRTSGQVLLGVSEILHHTNDNDKDDGPTYVARLATTCNEDLYRILHTSMQPLAETFGVEFYRDRIHASQTRKSPASSAVVATTSNDPTKRHTTTTTTKQSLNLNPSSSSSLPSWSAYMLADSALPTGSFAHSAGVEAAAQLGILSNQHALYDFVRTSIRSSLQLQVPFVIASQTTVKSVQDWRVLDRQVHAYMVSNSMACHASLEQGQGLLRVALSLLQDGIHHDDDKKDYAMLLNDIQESIVMSIKQNDEGHLAPIFGIVCLSLGLSTSEEACQLLGYCTARDMVSAAVRLNLIGPMAGASLLNASMEAVTEGIASGTQIIMYKDKDEDDDDDDDLYVDTNMIQAATCAPIAETIHPCHDILSARLFRT